MKLVYSTLLGWIVLSLATPAFAADDDKKDEKSDASIKESDEESEEKEEKKSKDWRVGVRVGTSIGQGTFAAVENENEYFDPSCTHPIEMGCVGDAGNAFDRVRMSYGINGSYTLQKFTFSTGLNLGQWLTAGGGINGPGEVRLSDSGLGISHAGYTFESIGVNIAPSLGLQFPTSRFARIQTLILGTNLGVSISKTLFDRLGLSLNLGVGRDFHRFKGPLLNEERLQEKLDDEERANLPENVRPEAVVHRDSEELKPGLVAIGGVNTAWSLSTGLSAGFAVYKKLRLSASYNISTSWTYALNDCAECEPAQDFIQGNRGVGQGFSTSVGLSYPVKIKDVSLGFSAGIGTGGYPKTSDNKSFRFPFWNTSGAAANASSIRLGVSASY